MESAGGATSTIAYSSLGNPTSIIDPLGQQTTATYNATFDELTSITDPNGNALDYSYDPKSGNLTSVTFPDGSSQQYAYDATGQVTQFVNRDGQAVSFADNSNGFVASETFPGGLQDTFNYDSHQNLVSMTDSTGTTTFTYNAGDELTKVAYPDDTFLHYTYNSAGQRTQMTDQTGFTVNYQYNTLGQLTELTDGSGNPIASYSYDAAGRLSSEQFGNGTATDYTYDADSDILSIVNLAPNGSSQSSYVYTYNGQNQPVTMTTSAGTFAYGYDADGEVASVQTPGGGTITYEYDNSGNRIAAVVNGTATQYVTNDLNEYAQVGNTAYQYDANGDLISSTSSSGTTTYSYNVLGQLTSVVSPAGTTTYQYNGLGDLVSETVNGQTTAYLVDPTGIGSMVGQFNSAGSPIAQYAYGLELVSQVTASGSTNYYDFDASGNTTQLTGPSGNVLDTYSYLPFGDGLTATGAAQNPFTYAGQWGVISDSSGLYFMRNRWYDSAIGRFTEPDPSGLNGGSLNLYGYTNNSRLAAADPLGLSSVSLTLGAQFGIGGNAGLTLGDDGLYFTAGWSLGRERKSDRL